MGNASSDGRPRRTMHTEAPETASQNPLQRGRRRHDVNTDDDDERPQDGHQHCKSENNGFGPLPPASPHLLGATQPAASSDGNSHNHNHNATGGGTAGRSARRVSVAFDTEEDPPHQAPQRMPGLGPLRRSSMTDSCASITNSAASSRESSVNSRPRLTLGEAREILLTIFLPRQGDLECFLSGFLKREDYARMRGFWAPFLTTEMRDKWYLDAVMLSVLGKDRWRSSRQQKEIIMSVSPSREQVLQLNTQRREYNDQLRERLLDMCGALMEHTEHGGRKTHLQSLLDNYHRHTESYHGPAENNSGGAHQHDGNGATGPRGLANGGGAASSSQQSLITTLSDGAGKLQHQELLSLSLMRLQTTVSTSFDCFDLLARRIPTTVISALPSKYFLNSTPVVYSQIAYQEKKIGDLDALSFFMSIESRRRLLHGQTPDDTERKLNGSFTELGASRTSSGAGGSSSATAFHGYAGEDGSGGFNSSDGESTIPTAQKLYAAVRHAGLVVTTACSSMILTVLFHLADVIRARQTFRENRTKAAQRGITLEQLIGRKEATIRTYSGKPTEDVEELKRFAVTDEMSLAVLTKLLVERFRKENRAKAEKLRKRYPNIFAYLEAIAPPEEQADFDVTRLLSGMVLKLMFLTGGGQRSIAADDRRVPAGPQRTTDDVALSTMLEVPLLNRICWVGCMMGMPIMSYHGYRAQTHQGKPLSFSEMDECCGIMRALFQAVGALPCGNACPHAFKEWFPLFPFYAVNAEGKRILMYLYMAQVASIQRTPLTIQKDMTLLSFAAAFEQATSKGRVDIANYFFDPNLVVGYGHRDQDGEKRASVSLSTAASPSASKATRRSNHLTNATPSKVTAETSFARQPLVLSLSGDAASAQTPRGRAPTTTKSTAPAPAIASPTRLSASSSPSPVRISAAAAGSTEDKFQYMTAVSGSGGGASLTTVSTNTAMAAAIPGAGAAAAAAAATGNKATPHKPSTDAATRPLRSTSPLSHKPHQHAQEAQKLTLSEPASPTSSTSSSASLSCSTLLGDDMEVDVYTCVNPQAQLYLRCSNEATMRRHRATELTPSVSAHFYHSKHDVQTRRPDIAPALHETVPKLMPSEGFLVIRWTSAEPLVTICAGDIMSVMAERTHHAPSSSAHAGLSDANSNGGASNPAKSGSARYFTGTVRPGLDETDASSYGTAATKRSLDKPLDKFALTIPYNGGKDSAALRGPATGGSAISPRTHTVTIADTAPHRTEEYQGNGGTTPRAMSPSLAQPNQPNNGEPPSKFGGFRPEQDVSLHSRRDFYPNNLAAVGGSGGEGHENEDSASNSSFHAPEKTRLYQGVMHNLLGVEEKVSRRVGVRWTVVEVIPCSQLVRRSHRLSLTSASSGGAGTSLAKSPQSPQQYHANEGYRNEIVLHVAAQEMPVSVPLKILTIGHERASMSVFTFVSPGSDTVCWANPRLIDSIVNRADYEGSASASHVTNTDKDSAYAPLNMSQLDDSASAFLQAASSANGPKGRLCDTEEELHNVFFSIGVLLSNAIVNGVYLTTPIAPLAFLLLRKALMSGDYSFKSFMWLEPVDGNLLSPALLLNSAYEILTMTDQQYVAFLRSRGLGTPDTQIFPVMHSLAKEMEEDKAWQLPNTPNASAAKDNSKRAHQSLPPSSSSRGGKHATRSSMVSNVSSETHDYLRLIQLHNRHGSTFQRSLGGGGGGSRTAAPGDGMPQFLSSSSVSVQDRLQGYRAQSSSPDQGKRSGMEQSGSSTSLIKAGRDHRNSGSASEPKLLSTGSLYAKLPSRREYLSLYLVNDLAWGSVRRDGIGEKNKELWVSMARGFMTSTLAKSPLLANCCSRVVREMLCVPGANA